MRRTKHPRLWDGAAGSEREAPAERDTKIINPGRQTSSSEDLPDGLQTAEDKGSYCDTNWTMSMLGYGGIQPKKKKKLS